MGYGHAIGQRAWSCWWASVQGPGHLLQYKGVRVGIPVIPAFHLYFRGLLVSSGQLPGQVDLVEGPL